MTNIETTYAGLKLKNPIIVASSGLTDSAAKNQKMEKAGAGAIVLKSLFEEQILRETASMTKNYSGMDGCDYLETYVRQHQLANYIKLIADTKKVCTIPVIASISCYDDAGWTEFAQQIEQAGADAIEVNMMALQTATDYAYGSFEKRAYPIEESRESANHHEVGKQPYLSSRAHPSAFCPRSGSGGTLQPPVSARYRH